MDRSYGEKVVELEEKFLKAKRKSDEEEKKERRLEIENEKKWYDFMIIK